MRTRLIFIVLIIALGGLLVADICVGAVTIPVGAVWKALWGNSDASAVLIVRHIRLIKAFVAILAGMALSVSGLQMQTLFRNPLSGPYVLGISSGASLGVALVILGSSVFGSVSSVGVVLAAWIGSAAVLALIAAASVRIKDIMVILILGIMLSSAVSAVVQVLQYLSGEEALKSFVMWTMGSLGDVTASKLPILVLGVVAGLTIAVFTVKPLNMLLLGENYARSLGLNVGRSRMLIMVSTTLLAGTVTAFCGPIGFIGLAMPHVARALFGTADHRVVLPGAALVGAVVMLVCDVAAKQFTLPINSVTSLVGIPIVIWIVLKSYND